jgi:molybdopterin-guanine dinucleotide biosynthesis protein A
MNNLAILILAGGKSSRMGKDKALIKINHKPLLQRTCEIALQCTEIVYVITPRFEVYQTIIPSSCIIIPEEQPFYQGPLIAFSQALPSIPNPWILLLAVDLPFLDAREIKAWIPYLAQLNQNVIAFLPKNHQGWECLCGFYRRDCLQILREFINHGGRSFQKWLQLVPVETIPVKNQRVLFNCNSPSDLEFRFNRHLQKLT